MPIQVFSLFPCWVVFLFSIVEKYNGSELFEDTFITKYFSYTVVCIFNLWSMFFKRTEVNFNVVSFFQCFTKCLKTLSFLRNVLASPNSWDVLIFSFKRLTLLHTQVDAECTWNWLNDILWSRLYFSPSMNIHYCKHTALQHHLYHIGAFSVVVFIFCTLIFLTSLGLFSGYLL